MKKQHVVFSLILSLFFLLPLFNHVLPLEHDTLFHLSRIEGYAQALKKWDFFPIMYQHKNMGYGYPIPLFYPEIFLLIPSILYNLNFPLIISYKIALFLATFFSSLSIMFAINRLSTDKYSPYLASILYIFNNYRISDAYVRSALGEIYAFIFLPLLFVGIYEFFYKDFNHIHYLIIGFCGLLLSHLISFYMAIILFILFLFLNIKKMTKKAMIQLSLAASISIAISAYFLFPLLEQLLSQSFYLSHTSPDFLKQFALYPWQYFSNTTVFGLGSNDLPRDQIMCLNIGIALSFLPWLALFQKPNIFRKHCFLLGLVFLLFTSIFIPFDLVPWLSVIQFPWRLLTIVVTCMIFVATWQPKVPEKVVIIVSLVLLGEGIFHILPVQNRPFVINNTTTYQDIIDGSIIDPFYAATFMRVEIAAGDYLPSNSMDFRELSGCVTTLNNEIITCDINRGYNQLQFAASANQQVLLPLSYYKGYIITTSLNERIIPYNEHGLVSFTLTDATQYTCTFKRSFIGQISLLVSFIACFLYAFSQQKNRIKNQ